MSAIESSIVIPVCNNWKLTHACLKSIAETTDISRIEIIIIDNASSDETREVCQSVGTNLFGNSFRILYNDINRNFAAASNQGAEIARGDFVIFLNNDTEPQPGWYLPLMEDFVKFPDIAATGPLLAYPESGPFGRSIQHLGVVFNPLLRVSHLYKGIPLNSPLAHKRRFFQAITAACMVMPRNVFLESGEFDENFINGFEDVDLCARLWSKGYRFTVNPDSLVLHHESRTPGRNKYENRNSTRLENGNLGLFIPDWHIKIENDDLCPVISQFGVLQASYEPKITSGLNEKTRSMGIDALTGTIKRYPLWEKGWQTLLSQTRDVAKKYNIFSEMFQLFKTPENALTGCNLAMRLNNAKLLGECFSSLKNSIDSPEFIFHKIEVDKTYCYDIGLEKIAAAYGLWLQNYDHFKNDFFPNFARSCIKLAERIGYPVMPANAQFYNLWLHRKRKQYQEKIDPEISFSILMPTYNHQPKFFKKALNSVLNQTWKNWELCLADDASPDAEIRQIIKEYAQKDSRIKYIFRKKNGHIAAATNSALKLAQNEWSVFMDDDDELRPDALEKIANAITAHPEGSLFYSDEDKITEYGNHNRPHLKNGKWDPELLRQQNFVCHVTACNTGRLREIGGLRNGFDGSQDHELILRYSENLDKYAFVHVPEILYNWREHENSTARNVGVKGYALDNAVKAVQSHLDRTVPGAAASRMENDLWIRIKYPAPSKPLLVSLIVPAIPFNGFESFCRRKTSWPFEIVKSDKDATGEILFFLDPTFLPYSQNWLEELVSCLMRPGIGAVSGSLVQGDGRQLHAGYMGDSTTRLKPIFHNASKEPYIGWMNLGRTVEAVDGFCMITRKSDLEAMGGLDPSFGVWAFQDYCLRLQKNNLVTIWWPFAKFIGNGVIELPDAPQSFHEKWKIEPFNRNLKIADQGFALDMGA